MLILILILLVCLALVPVLIPFFRSPEAAAPGLEQAELQELLAEKQMIYAAIKELEFDHQAGKLSLEDYEQARHSYDLRAIAILQEIDRVGTRRDAQDVGSGGKRSQ
jgi:hypothetical protein